MIVTCVRQGVKYERRYVEALAKQIPPWIKFCCLTDSVINGYDTLLMRGYKGWLAKMELFSPEHSWLRPCLYLDLDTFIVGDIEPILLSEPTDLWLTWDFYRRERANSGIMLIPKDTSAIWGEWIRYSNVVKRDGDFLNDQPHKILQSKFSGILSYKVDCQKELPRGARIVCFHGKPRPHEVENGWARDYWCGVSRTST